MKIYFIYKHGGLLQPSLYAITDKKKLKNSFIKERKKDIFTVKEKEVTKEELTMILRNHSSYLLGRHGFETQSMSSDLPKKCYIYLTTTFKEEIDVVEKEDSIFLYLGKLIDDDAKFFNEKLLKALNELHYFEIYKFVNQIYMYNDYFVKGVEEIYTGKYKLDLFSVFLFLYGDTLDKKGLIENG